jgi:hypothetical protein
VKIALAPLAGGSQHHWPETCWRLKKRGHLISPQQSFAQAALYHDSATSEATILENPIQSSIIAQYCRVLGGGLPERFLRSTTDLSGLYPLSIEYCLPQQNSTSDQGPVRASEMGKRKADCSVTLSSQEVLFYMDSAKAVSEPDARRPRHVPTNTIQLRKKSYLAH